MKSQKFTIGGQSNRSYSGLWAILLLIVGGLLLNSTLARAQTDAPPAATQAISDWAHVIVMGDGANIGRRPSLDIHPDNNRPYISFYDGFQQRLGLAWYTADVNDTCLSPSWEMIGWKCVVADSTATAGNNSALAFLQNGSDQVGIAYTIPNSDSQIVSRFDANGVFVATDSTQNAGGGDNYIEAGDLIYKGSSPIWSSEIFDGQHKQLVVLDDRLPGTSILVERDDTTTSNKLGRYASLDLGPGYNGIDGMTTRVAYSSELGRLRYAEWQNGNGGGCSGTAFKWVCQTVDFDANVYATSLYSPKCTDCGENTRIAYFDAVTGNLKMATDVGNNSCNPGSTPGWQCQVIDAIAVGETPDGIRVSMVVQNGQIKIAYTDKDDQANSILKLATYTGNANDVCTAGGATGWTCEVVDDGGNQDNTGIEPSMAWKGDLLYIAYHNLSKGRLMVAYPKVDLAGQVSFSLNLPDAPVAVEQDFTFSYTINNASSVALTDMEFADHFALKYNLLEVVDNTCLSSVEIQNGWAASTVRMETGALSSNTVCTVTIRAQIRPGSPLGVYTEAINDPLTSNEAYPIDGIGDTLTVKAKIFLPAIMR